MLSSTKQINSLIGNAEAQNLYTLTFNEKKKKIIVFEAFKLFTSIYTSPEATLELCYEFVKKILVVK